MKATIAQVRQAQSLAEIAERLAAIEELLGVILKALKIPVGGKSEKGTEGKANK